MARLPRLYAPGQPQLIQASFSTALNHHGTAQATEHLNQLVAWLKAGAREKQVALHAWALSYDQVLLLATPTDAQALPRLMQTLGRNLAARLRTGRVFSSRYRSTLVEAGTWLLPAQIWLETLPVRTGITGDAESWPWSSAGLHAGTLPSSPVALSDHPDYWQCGNTPFDRQARYRALLQSGLGQAQARRIAQALYGQWALGDPAYTQRLGADASRRATPGKRGRPRKTPPESPAQ
ncbi:hypothetical protein [Corticimicrobacter populi]|uniref:Transposase IS200-like domain-containing protein n=1 Tax=Corticimicrobacter populi TaxID=2175229 RepID=A0A2V1JWD8_9BURK|nr:hypothetical protein [Corticimicrobacter populi]PWF21565.1 hypothetical protein DD235_15060 [Corticimicrobacter populi]